MDIRWHLGEKHTQGESIAQRSRRAQRGMGCGRVFFGRHRRLLGEKHALGESIALRSRRAQRGVGCGGVRWATPADSGRETRARGKASHKGHGEHRGEWVVVAVLGRVRLRPNRGSRAASPDNVSPHDRAAHGRRIENEHENDLFWG